MKYYIVLFTFVAFAASAYGGPLVSINPALNELYTKDGDYGVADRYGLESVVSRSRFTYPENKADGSKIEVSRDGLNGRWLFGSMIEASSSSQINIAFGAKMHMVRFAVEQQQLVVYKDDPTVPEGPGITEEILNRYPCVDNGGQVSVDLTKPEVSHGVVRFGNAAWNVTSGGQVYDLTVEADYVGWVEKFICISTESGDEPITLFLRFFFKRHLKSESYQPRVYSDQDNAKYGYFRSKVKTLNQFQEPVSVDVINRHDIAKPITYYIHPIMPEEYREAVREGILSWNDVFEATNGVRPIEVLDGEAHMLPSDIRYKVIYWVDHITPGSGGGAYGPSTCDPLTGEIIDGDVVIFGRQWVASLSKKFQEAQAAQAAAASNGSKSDDAAIAAIEKQDRKPLTISFSGGVTWEFEARGFDPDMEKMAAAMLQDDNRPDDLRSFLCEYFKGVMCHEVGHTLGLRHNFSASADSANLQEGQVSTSIMDYIDFNKMTLPGIYDYAAIAYGYDGDASFHTDKNLRFFTDEHAGIVPDCNQFDEGDPYAFYLKRYEGLERYFARTAAQKNQFNASLYDRYAMYYFEPARKYVGFPGPHAEEAFAYFYNNIIKEPEGEMNEAQRAHNAARRRFLTLLLFAAKPKQMAGSWSPMASFRPLNEQQQEYLLRAFAWGLKNDATPMSFRKDCITFLKAMQSPVAYKALKSALRGLKWSAFKDGVNIFQKTDEQIKAERRELSARIKQALANYFQ